ncbi:hypothetical protein GCM10009611_18660 [Arthrobacter roseus]
MHARGHINNVSLCTNLLTAFKLDAVSAGYFPGHRARLARGQPAGHVGGREGCEIGCG